jgi:hypothetical protein
VSAPGGVDAATSVPQETSNRWSIVLTAVACGLLVAYSVASYRQQPHPPVVYNDDAWPLIGAKVDGLLDLRRTGFTSTGFMLLERLWFGLTSFSTGNARVIPFAFFLAIGPTAVLVGRWLGLHLAAALVGAALLVTSPELASMATHAKQYTFEVVASLVLLGLAGSVLRAPDRLRRWVAFAGVGAASMLMSFALVGIVVSGAAVALLALLRGGVDRRTVRSAVLVIAVLAVFSAGLYLLLRPVIPFDALESFWEDFYITSPHSARWTLVRMFQLGFAWPALMGVAVVISTVVVGWRRPMLALLFGLPFGFGVVLAIAKAAPIGGGRTDVWLYAALALMVAVAVDVVITEVPRRWQPSTAGSRVPVARVLSAIAVVAAAALLLGQAGRGFPGGPDEYGQTSYRAVTNIEPLVDALEAGRGSKDLVVVAPVLTFQYPLYAPQRARTHFTDSNVAGWYPDLRGVDDIMGGSYLVRDKAAFEKRMQSADRVWTLDTPGGRYPLAPGYAELLTRAGFTRTEVSRVRRGLLTRWDRRGE